MEHTQKSFLRRLRLCLVWRLSPDEVQGVIEDYGGFFTDRLSEGMSEAEICMEFGRPRQVAKNILSEEGRSRKPMGLLAFVWAALGVWLVWGYSRDPYFSPRRSALCLLLSFLIVPLLWLIWRKSLPPVPLKDRRKFFLLCGLPLPVWGVVYGYVNWVAFYVEKITSSGHTAKIVHFLGILEDSADLALALILLLSLLLAWWESPRYLIPAAHCMGALIGIGRVMLILRNMDPASGFNRMVLNSAAISLAMYLALSLGGMAFAAILTAPGKGGGYGRAA